MRKTEILTEILVPHIKKSASLINYRKEKKKRCVFCELKSALLFLDYRFSRSSFIRTHLLDTKCKCELYFQRQRIIIWTWPLYSTISQFCGSRLTFGPRGQKKLRHKRFFSFSVSSENGGGGEMFFHQFCLVNLCVSSFFSL